ncbi:prolipoprotein diacylglyceryl transferase [[Clostridium] cellulosi]|uniref:Phosphatidylglycerol--prolipoprotein diacylglyceryl transferase n=1 Tax=[Clostridium] cellulosi TaxID=29343 RepID=A0A078KMQ4_9FIRM|nr:prolipoprotein diacylglyceryl transferase [[Clostridium] cellulosi]
MFNVSFPGLGIKEFSINPTAFTVFGHPIAWYGIIIASALLLAMVYGMVRAKEFNISVDDLSDLIIFGIIFGVIGARIYYVLFPYEGSTTNEFFEKPITILYIWNGGLAIYGGIIGAFLSSFVVAKIKKISIGAVFDIASLGFLIGQTIGRWGNFVNGEAYGYKTNLPWRMVLSFESDPVHPCFLYESLWCLIGFIILHIYSKRRKFNGEIFLMYITWYSFGRFFIEGIRADSLMQGNLKVSQLLSAILFIAAVSLLIYKRVTIKKVILEQTTEYNPLFDETSKAVEEETAREVEKYLGNQEDEEDEGSESEEESADSADASADDVEGQKEEDSDNTENSDKSEDKE